MPDNCEICIALKKKRKKKRKKNHASCEKEECEKKKKSNCIRKIQGSFVALSRFLTRVYMRSPSFQKKRRENEREIYGAG